MNSRRTNDIPPSTGFGCLGRSRWTGLRDRCGEVVVANWQEQSDGEKIEEIVIASEDDEELQSKLKESTDAASE